MSCVTNEEYLQLASTEGMFGMAYEWLIWLRNESDISLLENIGLSISSEVTVIISELILYDIYRPEMRSDLIITEVGKWSKESGLEYDRKPRVHDFGGATIFGGIFFIQDVFDRNNLSAQLQDRTYCSNKDIVNRYFYMLNLYIADLYNYTLQLVETDGWGNELPDGQHTGLLGQLESKVTNISVGPLLMLAERTKFTDLLPPMLEYWMPFVFRQPRALGSYRALSLPFMPTTWVAVACVLVLATIIFYKIHTDDGEKINFSESIILVIGIFTQQGLVKDPAGFSGRMLCLTMLIMGVLVMLYYNAATMTALLSSTPPKIRNLDQLVSSKVHLALMDAPYFNNKMARSRVLEKIVINKIDKYSSSTLHPLEDGLQIVLNGGAFIAEYFTIFEGIDKTFKDSQKCDLTYIPGYKPFLIASFAQKNSYITEIYNRAFIKLMEHGLARREREKWIVQQPKCTGKEQFIFVSLEAITIALGTFAAGAIISIIIFLMELISYRKRRNVIMGQTDRRQKSTLNHTPVLPLIN